MARGVEFQQTLYPWGYTPLTNRGGTFAFFAFGLFSRLGFFRVWAFFAFVLLLFSFRVCALLFSRLHFAFFAFALCFFHVCALLFSRLRVQNQKTPKKFKTKKPSKKL